jgi:hypothetical protein
MNSLMIALAGLGGLILAALVIHGRWQARKAGPKRASAPVVLREHEPVMGDLGAPASPPSGVPVAPGDEIALVASEADAALPGADATAVVTPRPVELAAEREESAPEPAPKPSFKRAPSRIDTLIDAVATLTLDGSVTGAFAVSHLPPSRRAGSKPFIIEGLNTETSVWELPTHGQHYSEFQAAVQQANRTGALNEIEYSEFVQKVQTFADAFGALVDFPDMLDVVDAARKLDQFASQHDAQLAVRLQTHNVAWSVGYVQEQASRNGFVAGSMPGRWVLMNPQTQGASGSPPMLVLTFDSQAALADDPNQAAVREIVLSFDVPQTESAAEPFVAWQTSAQTLASNMGAQIVDDQGQELTLASFAAIREELSQLYTTLENRDLAAGSAPARRLFS